jgi:hypothetical protein
MSFSNDSLEVNKMLVVYWEMGRLQEAAAILRFMGILDDEGLPLTVELLDAHAEACCEVWGVKNPDRAKCYLCNNPQPVDRLCSCYWSSVVNTSNCREVVNALSERDTYATYLCQDCRKLQKVAVQNVQMNLKKYSVFRIYETCMGCTDLRKKQRHSAPPMQVRAPIRGLDALKLEAKASQEDTPSS